MVIKRVIGIVFLALFIGLTAYKLLLTLGDQQDGGPMLALILVAILFLVFVIVKIVRGT